MFKTIVKIFGVGLTCFCIFYFSLVAFYSDKPLLVQFINGMIAIVYPILFACLYSFLDESEEK